MACDPAEDRPRPVVVDISSDEGSPPIVHSNDDFDWLGEFLYEDGVEGLAAEEEEEDEDDVVIIGEFSHPDKSRKRKSEVSEVRDCAVDDDDDECLVLDGDPDKVVATVEGNKGKDDRSDSEDLMVVGEKGQVACRDYPHPRHDCAKFPFAATPHMKHCNLCHCYVCDSLAPCIYWGTGMSNSDHCHATDKDRDWKIRRKDLKSGKSANPDTFGIAHIGIPLPAQTLHNGGMPSAACPVQQTLLSQPRTVHPAGHLSTPIPTDLIPQNPPPLPAIYHPPSKTTSPANDFPVRLPTLQRCYSSSAYNSSSDIYSGVRKQPLGNFKAGQQPCYAQGRISHAISIVRPNGHHVRSNIRPQYSPSVQRSYKTETVCRPSPSRAEYVSNNPCCAPQVQCSGKFPKYTVVRAGHNKILGQNGRLHIAFSSDMRNSQLTSTSTLPNMVHSGSSGLFHPNGLSGDAQYRSPVYQHIEDHSRVFNQSDNAHHQNQGVSLHYEAETVASTGHQPPTRESDHPLPQEFDLGSMTMNNNWWLENDLPQDQISLEPPPAALYMDPHLFDFETP